MGETSPRRNHRRRLLTIAAILLLVLPATYFLITVIIERRIGRLLREGLAVPATVDRIDVSLLRGRVHARNFNLPNPDGFSGELALGADELLIDFDYRFGGNDFVIKSISATGVRAAAERNGLKQRNYDRLRVRDEEEEDDETERKGKKRKKEKRTIIIESIELRDLVFLIRNSEEGRHSGEVRIVGEDIEVHGLKLHPMQKAVVDHIKAAGISVEGPGMGYPEKLPLSIEAISFIQSPESNIEVTHPVIVLAWREDGESNAKRIRRVIEAVLGKEELRETSNSTPLPENKSTSRQGVDRATDEPAFRRIAVRGGLLKLMAEFQGEWRSEDYPGIEVLLESGGGTPMSLSVARETPKLLDFNYRSASNELHIRLNAREFPIHPLLWHKYAEENFRELPRVDHALLDSDIELQWIDGHLSGETTVQFRQVRAGEDRRSLWERLRQGPDWAATLNDLASAETGDARPVHIVFDEEAATSQPIILLSLFRQRFHEARQKSANDKP